MVTSLLNFCRGLQACTRIIHKAVRSLHKSTVICILYAGGPNSAQKDSIVQPVKQHNF